MSSQFWDLSHSVIRDDDQVLDGAYEPTSSGQQCPFGTSSEGGNWFWGSSDLFSEQPNRANGLLFDLPDGMFGKLNPHSDPVSPSSVATTPTTSEHPVSGAPSGFDEEEDNDSRLVSHINVNKRIRKTYSAPAATTNSNTAAAMDKNGRKKKYDAPPGVWRNSGGFISTVYINKKRVYGPLRRDVTDAVKDREEMLLAKSVITSEEAMRAFVQSMKERWGPNRQSVTCVDQVVPFMTGGSSNHMLLDSTLSVGDYRVYGSSTRQSPQPAASSSVIRVSSRPVRAAARRNMFTAFGSNSSFDGASVEEEDELNAPMSLDDTELLSSSAFF